MIGPRSCTLPPYFRVPTHPKRRCHWLPADGGNRAMGYGVLGLTGSPTGLTNHKLDKDSCVERSCRLCQLHCIGRVHTMLATPHPVHFEKLSSIGPRSVAGLETTRERAVPRSFVFLHGRITFLTHYKFPELLRHFPLIPQKNLTPSAHHICLYRSHIFRCIWPQ